MERRVKERLIGASILVALIVLVVPELLSGPKPAARPATLPATLPATAPEPTRNVTVDLATSKAPANPDVDAAAPSAPASASPSTAPAPATPGVATPAPQAPTPQAPTPQAPTPQTPAPVESSAPPPISSRAAWAVQLGSFANRPNADKLARQLKGQGFSVYVVTGGSAASVRYRVRIGPLADRGSAERTVTKLKSIGHASSLVAPAS
jgi:DedD protein